MKKLISMTSFVFNQNEVLQMYKNHDKGVLFERCINYANFLKQPLNLGMFVPVDEKGNVLEEKSIFNTTDEDYIFDSELFDEYHHAKERCLFEFNSDFLSFTNEDMTGSNIEELLSDDYDYILTQTEI